MKKNKKLPVDNVNMRTPENQHRVGTTQTGGCATNAESNQLYHELKVQQIELEMQNVELHQARDEAESLLNKFADLYEFAPVCYVSVDRIGTILNVNNSCTVLFGTDKSGLIRHRFGQFVVDENRQTFADYLDQVFGSQIKELCEITIENKHSHRFRVQLLAEAAASGLECRLAVIDISARNRAEERLRNKEERLSLALSAAGMASWDWHIPSGDVVWNEMHFRMMGYEPGEVQPTYQAWASRVHPDDIAAAEFNIRQRMAEGGTYSAEFRTLWPDGTIRWLEARGEFEYDANTQPLRNYGVMLDITERKLAEKQLLEAHEKLELRVRERTEELAAVVESLQTEITERKRSQEQLRQSEERYRTLIEDQTELISRYNADGSYTFVNEVFCRMFGKTREELLGSKWFPDAYPEDVIQIKEQLNSMSPANPIVVIENRIYNGAGQVRWLQFVNRGFFDAAGQLIETQAVGRDITDRKLAEDALQGSEARFSTIFHANPLAIGISRLDNGPFIDVNDSFLSIFGLSRSEVLGRTSMELGLWPFPEERDMMLSILKEHGRLQQYEAHYRHKSGKIGIIIVSAEMVELRGKRYLLGMLSEISERKRIEQALVSSEERYRRLFEVESDALFMIDCETGRFTDANTAAITMYGYTQEELLQLTVTDISDEPEKSEQSVRDQLTTVPLRWHRKKDGTIFPVEISGSYFEYQGRMAHVAAIRDITLRKQAEESLRAYAQRLIEIEENLRRKLAADLHDEIGTELSVLGMNMAFISQSLPDGEQAKLHQRLAESDKLIASINRNIRGIMTGLRPPVLDDFGLPAALRWHADLYSKRTGINVQVLVEEPFSRLAPEQETALFRISQEALMNIAKHAHTQAATITLAKDENLVRFTIVDHGKGFLPASSLHYREGAGWGLKIMRERAELIGGKFQVDSEPGKGTTVSVLLPMEEM